MITIRFEFPGSRYHATPYGHEPNEGLVEWPPAPWRIARALLATYHLKVPDLDEKLVLNIVTHLASGSPSYSLPEASLSHTRHYMPRIDKNATRLTFDTFLHIEKGGQLLIQWKDLVFTEEEHAALGKLLNNLGYIGRAESWVQATLVDCEELESPDASIDRKEGDLVKLMAILDGAELNEHLEKLREVVKQNKLSEKQMTAAKKGKKIPEKLSPKEILSCESKVPTNAKEVLEQDIAKSRKQGWSILPGTRVLKYRRPPLEVTTLRTEGRRNREKPTIAHFHIASQVIPRFTDFLRISEKIHQKLVKVSDGKSSHLRGTDDSRQALKNHQHTSIFFDTDKKRGIGSFTLYCPKGFTDQEIEIFQKMKPLWEKAATIQIIPIFVGGEKDAGNDLDDFFGSSKVWKSATPFVGTRHPKRNRKGEPKFGNILVMLDGKEQFLQKASPVHDLLRLLELGGHPMPIAIRTIKATIVDDRETAWRYFGSTRKGGKGARGPVAPTGFELEFEEELKGPLSFGYGSHFGLGLFTCVSEKK